MDDNKVFHDAGADKPEKKPFYFPSLILGLLAIACTFLNVASVGQVFGLLGVIFSLRRREEYFVIPSLIVSALGLGYAFYQFWAAVLWLQMGG
ncbi:MAG: hypothetical protein IJ792_03330 [Oscillospiraceae bacterium]|nr:hypothetical protein [Oscillospiraceae bacterium]